MNRTTAIPAYNLLNEALATAFGNGLVAEEFANRDAFIASLEKPLSFYNDPSIDAAGKAVFRWLKPYLAGGGTLYDRPFVERYVASLESAMPERLSMPRAYLTSLLAFTDRSIPGLTGNALAQPLRVASYSRHQVAFEDPAESAPLKATPNTSAIIVVTPANGPKLGSLGFLSTAQAKEFQRATSAIFAFRRNSNAIGYVIVATSAEAVLEATQRIANEATFKPGWLK